MGPIKKSESDLSGVCETYLNTNLRHVWDLTVSLIMKLITWNIQWGCGADGRVDLDRIVANARWLGDFDVLCLQEVSAAYPELAGCDGSDQFQGITDCLPGYTAVAGVATDTPHSSGKRRSFGNMIFSRLPVLQVFRHLLPWPAEHGVLSMQRLALEATLETPLGLVRVTTTISNTITHYSGQHRWSGYASCIGKLLAKRARHDQATHPMALLQRATGCGSDPDR